MYERELSVEDTQKIEIIKKQVKKKREKPNKDKEKLVIAIICSFLLILSAVFGVGYLVFSKAEKISDDTTQTTILSQGEIVIDPDVNLNNYASNITIKEGGEYTLSGSLKYSVIIDSTSDVTLNLNNVNITSTNSGGIIGKGTGNLNINLVKGTNNKVSDGGTSSYDAAIYSNSELTFDGTGKLTINGNQTNGEGIGVNTNNLTFKNGTYIINSADDGIKTAGEGGTITINNGTFYIDSKGNGIDSKKDALINDGKIVIMSSNKTGIKTIKGFNINGGSLVSLGSDVIELPLSTSKQNSLCISLNNDITAESIVSLMNNNTEIVTFKSLKNFKNIIISSKSLYKGATYVLYKDGTESGSAVYGLYDSGKYTIGTKVNSYELNDVVGSFVD